MAGFLPEDPKSSEKTKKLVMSTVLSAFVIIMSLGRPWEHRVEIMGSLLIPPIQKQILVKNPETFFNFVKNKNSSKVSIIIDSTATSTATLSELGFLISSPEIDAMQKGPSLVDGLLATFFTPAKPSSFNAQLALDHDVLEAYLEKLRSQVEVAPIKPSVAWSEEKKWHYEPLKRGVMIDDDSLQTSLPELISALQQGKAEPDLKLKTKSVRPDLTNDERAKIQHQLATAVDLTELPITVKLGKNETRTLELSSAPDYITINDTGAQLNEAKVSEWIDGLQQEFYKQPGYVRIVGKDEVRKGVYKAKTEGDFSFGQDLKKEEVMSAIQDALKKKDRTASVIFDHVPFTVYSDLEQTPYDVLSVGYSEYSTGNHADRVHNFTTGLKRVSGTLVDRGQTISFNNALGKLDNEFVKGLGIFGTAASPVLGGGLCQASTTFYRAILNLGVPVEQRKSHSWDLSYYRKGGYGLDATVFPGQGLDIKAKNDIGSQLYFYAYTRPETLEAFVLVYGKGDGRKVVLKPQQDYKFVRGPKTIKWDETVTLASGEVKEYKIVSVYTK